MPHTTLTPTFFCCRAPEAHAVALMGAFEGCDQPIPMRRNSRGDWIVWLELGPGCYEYHFVAHAGGCCAQGGGATDRNCRGREIAVCGSGRQVVLVPGGGLSVSDKAEEHRR